MLPASVSSWMPLTSKVQQDVQAPGDRQQRTTKRLQPISYPPKLPARMTCACRQESLLGANCSNTHVRIRLDNMYGLTHLPRGQRGPEDRHLPVAIKLQPPALVALSLSTSVQEA